MKVIKCEICDSIDVVRQGDYFVCQQCGAKFELKPESESSEFFISGYPISIEEKDAIDSAIASGSMIEAISVFRKATGADLVTSKAAIEAYMGVNEGQAQTVMSGQESESRGCYVATCVYGSYDCPQVWTLRRFRDFDLAKTRRGRGFIKLYYAVSPALVRLFGDTAWFKRMWLGPLNNLVRRCRAKGYSDKPYQDRIW